MVRPIVETPARPTVEEALVVLRDLAQTCDAYRRTLRRVCPWTDSPLYDEAPPFSWEERLQLELTKPPERREPFVPHDDRGQGELF